jgi:multiple sugar transport system substrate-binding protein
MIIPSGAKCPDGAWAFMCFWSGLEYPEIAAEFYTWGGWIPISSRIVNTEVFQAYLAKYPQFQTYVDIIYKGNLQVMPPVTYQNYLADRLWQMELGIRHLSFSPEEGLKKVEQEMIREEARLSEWSK